MKATVDVHWLHELGWLPYVDKFFLNSYERAQYKLLSYAWNLNIWLRLKTKFLRWYWKFIKKKTQISYCYYLLTEHFKWTETWQIHKVLYDLWPSNLISCDCNGGNLRSKVWIQSYQWQGNQNCLWSLNKPNVRCYRVDLVEARVLGWLRILECSKITITFSKQTCG